MENKILEREILFSKDFSRLKLISLAVDRVAVKDTAQNRQSHSFEVANTIEILNQTISQKVGFDTDPRKIGRCVGLLHDIGHTAFGHEGERVLNEYTQKYSGGVLFFEGNNNNYIKLKKNKILNAISNDTARYVLASLAKHPEKIYPELLYIKKLIKIETENELRYIRKFMDVETLQKTLQCQVMDIADEISYAISDLMDATNVLRYGEIDHILKKNLEYDVYMELKGALYNKANFHKALNKLFYRFCDNFILNESGEIVPISQEIENTRQTLMEINRRYLLQNPKIVKIRKKMTKKLEKVYGYFYENEVKLPSKYYSKQYKFAKSKIEKLKVKRNFLGSLTDKGLNKLYKKIKEDNK